MEGRDSRKKPYTRPGRARDKQLESRNGLPGQFQKGLDTEERMAEDHFPVKYVYPSGSHD